MPLDVDQLVSLHHSKRLRLATTVGVQGFVNLDGDPELLISELLRLAKMGQRVEAVRLGIMRGKDT